jgi:hypothetical protein
MKKLSAKLITLEKINSKHIEEGWLDWLNQKQNLKLLNNPTKKYTKKNY